MIRFQFRLLPALALAGCAPVVMPVAVPVAPPVITVSPLGLDRVLGQNARTLATLFGAPNQDVREGPARRLQYASGVCVLDAYLYPPAGGGEPVVRHIDARLPTGDDFDRASCIAALSRRAAR